MTALWGWLTKGARKVWLVLLVLAAIAVPWIALGVTRKQLKRTREDLAHRTAQLEVAREKGQIEGDAAAHERRIGEELRDRLRELQQDAEADATRFIELRAEMDRRVGPDEAAKLWRETFAELRESEGG